MRKFLLVMLMTWLVIKPSSAQVVDFTLNDCNGAVLPGIVTGPANPVCMGSNFTLNYTGGVQGAHWVYLNAENKWEHFGSADQPINPKELITLNSSQTGSDQFRVRYLDGDCFSYSNIITVNYLLQSLAIDGTLFACEGADFGLSLNGNYSNILWSTSDTTPRIITKVFATTTYSVTATEQNGCTFTAQHTIRYLKKVSPVIQSSGLGTICGSGSVTLSFTGTSIADQCIKVPLGQYPENAYTYTNEFQDGSLEIITKGYLGSYSMVNVEAGKYYHFYSSGAEDIINLITNLDRTVVYAGGVVSAIWKATFTGKVLFITNGTCNFSDAGKGEIARFVGSSENPSDFGSLLWSNGQTTPSITVSPAATTNYTLSLVLNYFGCVVSSTKQVIVGIGSVALTTTNVTCTSATFNWSTPFDPTLWELEYKSTDNGSKWINVPVANSSTRSVTVPKLKPNQNYQWHLRAKCNKSTTAYSDLILFKTLATCTGSVTQSRSMNNAAPENEIHEIEGELKTVAMPNPSHTSFTITVSGNDRKERTFIQVVDIAGRIIETRSINGDQQIQLGEKYRDGIYIVRIRQGKQVKQLKLIKLRG